MTEDKRYYDLNRYLKSVFGCRVQKITLDAGFSCPNRDGRISRQGCIFCNSRGSGTGAWARGRSLTRQLEEGKRALARRYKAKKYLAYFQAFTNTYAPLEQLRAAYDEALAADGVVGLCVGTRPDCVDDAVLDLLQGYTSDSMVWLELGVQSARDETLQRINRGHDFACVKRTAAAAGGRGINLCAHVILGLPGETQEDMMYTAGQVAGLGFDGIKIHLLYVVAKTPLAAMYESGDYRCLTQAEYVDLTCDVIERLPETMVIQRLTGDPHADELVAPSWALRKQETLAAITQTLKDRGTRQGDRCRIPAGREKE